MSSWSRWSWPGSAAPTTRSWRETSATPHQGATGWCWVMKPSAEWWPPRRRSDFAPGDLVAPIVRRPDPVPCPNCAAGEWDMCRNGRFTEAGIRGLDGYTAEKLSLPVEFAVKVSSRPRALRRAGGAGQRGGQGLGAHHPSREPRAVGTGASVGDGGRPDRPLSHSLCYPAGRRGSCSRPGQRWAQTGSGPRSGGGVSPGQGLDSDRRGSTTWWWSAPGMPT